MIFLRDVVYEYRKSTFRLAVPSLEIPTGQTVGMIGPSGCGKTTLLHLIAGIKLPDTGTIVVDGVPLQTLSAATRRTLRLTKIGMVFQDFGLIAHLRVLDNILLPYRLGQGLNLTAEVRTHAAELATKLGIDTLLSRPIESLSRGEQQRVAVCRAMLPRPRLILADEPTGNLDPTTKDRVLDALIDLVQANGATLVMVTHDHSLLPRFDRMIDVATLLSPRQLAEASS